MEGPVGLHRRTAEGIQWTGGGSPSTRTYTEASSGNEAIYTVRICTCTLCSPLTCDPS